VNLTPAEKETFLSELREIDDLEFIQFDFSERSELEAFLNILDEHAILAISSQCPVINRNIDMFIALKFNKYNVYDIGTFYTNMTGKIPYDSTAKVWNLISENEFFMGINSYYKLKRVIDLALSAVCLVLSAPFFILLVPLITLTSRGPVFFVQERLGWNKKPFKLIKFRTMQQNAEKDTGPKWATENDPRITRLGKIMRKTRLDELPQLINVLKGDMSIVGNRPIRKHFAEILAKQIPHYDLRFIIKPGLTGWSQVKYDYAGSVEGQMEKFKFELFYIKNMSFLFDMIIILKTVKTVFGLDGK
jgi:lipopolysaccharide/colanic/teichoic acid biosynthesis glycosyltransferase